jgi:hypothetical protein
MMDSATLATIKSRFEQNMMRHPDVSWGWVQEQLPSKLNSLALMEASGGEPDVVVMGDLVAFFDCSAESPAGRRSLCYDRDGWLSRKDARPESTAVDFAIEMGIELLTEEQYRHLQTLGEFDLKTSSWLKTPPEIRALGGSIFADRRYGRIFVYHNGAQSYYASRGFRGCLRM